MKDGKAQMMGKQSRVRENAVAEAIKQQYDYLFRPEEICDRIGVKDGIIYFIEIKPKNRPLLLKNQELFRTLFPNVYRVVYG